MVAALGAAPSKVNTILTSLDFPNMLGVVGTAHRAVDA
jgi:hypothetical protein